MANTFLKRCSTALVIRTTALVIRKIEIKTTEKYYLHNQHNIKINKQR